jgi:transcriptional regulator with XRE-family HTH domain
MSISERLQKVFDVLNKTIKEVAVETGLPYRTLQNYLRGEREPNTEGLEKISRLGVNLHWLLTGEGAMFVQERDTLDFLVKEFEKFSDVRPPEPLSISAASFVDLYNSHGEDSAFPEWLRCRMPKLELQGFQDLIASKASKIDAARPSAPQPSLNPLLAMGISEVLFRVYGGAWNAFDEEARVNLFGLIHLVCSQLGASHVEDIEAVLDLAIKNGKAPARPQSCCESSV